MVCKPESTLTGHRYAPPPPDKQIASGGWDNTIKIWDSQSGDCQLTQRRLTISRLRVPNLEGFVDTAAGDLFSIGTPRHRKDPEIVRSQDTNQQEQRGKRNLKKKRTGLSAQCDRALELVRFFFNMFKKINKTSCSCFECP